MRGDKSLSVLLIDDDAAVREEIQALLALRNVDCKVAGDISEARAALSSDLERRIVLVDYHLPGMTGPEIIELLGAEVPGPLGFIVVTGDESQSAAIEAVRVGAADFLRKPIDGRELVRTITRVRDRLDASGEQAPAPREDHNAVLSVAAQEIAESLRDLSSQLRERERFLERFRHDERLPPVGEGEGWRRALSFLLRRLRAMRTALDFATNPADALAVETSAVDAERLIDTLATIVIGDQSLIAGMQSRLIDLGSLLQRTLPKIEQIARQKGVRFETRLAEEASLILAEDQQLSVALAELTHAILGSSQARDRLSMATTNSDSHVSLILRAECAPHDASGIRAMFDGLAGLDPGTSADDAKVFRFAACQFVIGAHGGQIDIEEPSSGVVQIEVCFRLAAERSSNVKAVGLGPIRRVG